MILRKLQSMKEVSWRNPEKPKMQENAVAGKSISRTGLPAVGARWITAGSTISAVTSSSTGTGRKGCIRRRAMHLSSSGLRPEMKTTVSAHNGYLCTPLNDDEIVNIFDIILEGFLKCVLIPWLKRKESASYGLPF